MERSRENEHVACALCGSDDTRYLFSLRDKILRQHREAFPVVRCRRCGLIYLNPRPAAGRRSSFYTEEYPYKAGKRPQPMEHYQPVIKFVQEQAGGGRILDIGTGNSPLLPVMRELGWEVHGTEIDAGLVEYFLDHHQIGLHHGELEEAAFPDEYFDAVTLLGVLEHVPNPRIMLEEVSRILKPGGVVAFWCFSRGLEAELLGRQWPGFDMPRHLYSFSQQTLCALLTRTGYRPVRTYRQSSTFIPYSFASMGLKIRNRLLGTAKPAMALNLPELVEKLSLPLGWCFARLGVSSTMYQFAIKE